MPSANIVSQVANTLFSGSPLQQLATVDFYKSSASSTPLNPIQQSEANVALSAATTARLVIASPSNPFVAALKRAAGGALPVNGGLMSSALNKLANSTGGISSSVLNDTTGLKSSILQLMGVTPIKDPKSWIGSLRTYANAINSGRLLVGQIQTSIKSGGLDSATGVLSLLTSITGNAAIASILDMTTLFAVGKALLNTISALQIPTLIDSVLGLYKNIEDQKYLLLNNLRNACLQSDMTAIQKTINIAGASACIATVPDIIKLILQYYRIPATLLVPYNNWLASPTNAPALVNSILTINNYKPSSPVDYSIGASTPVAIGHTDTIGCFSGLIPIPTAATYPSSSGITILIGGSSIGSYTATALPAGSAATGSAGSAIVQTTNQPTLSASSYPILLSTLKGILGQLNPNWYMSYRNSVLVPDLSVFTTMSPNAKLLFQTDSTTTPTDFFIMSTFGQYFTASDILSIALKYYSKAAIVPPVITARPASTIGHSNTSQTAGGTTVMAA